MSLTRVRDLVAVALVFGLLGYLVTRAWYLRLPPLSWPPGVTLLLVAAFEGSLAARLRAVIGHDPDARPMPAVVVARWIAVGRASALGGAVLTGLGGGFSVHVGFVLGDVAVAADDLVAGLVFTVGAVAVTAAGLLLERSGVAPRDDVGGRAGARPDG